MKFSDPSGHCATLDNGDPDWNDGICWRDALTIANMWDDTDYWQKRFGDIEVWNAIAYSGVEADFFENEINLFLNSDAGKIWLNDNPVWTPPQQDFGDFTTIAIAPGLVEIAFIFDDYGNVYVQGSGGAIGRGLNATRGDLFVTDSTGEFIDIDSAGLTHDEKALTAPDQFVGFSVDGSIGFMFLGIGGSVNLPYSSSVSTEGGVNSARGFSFSLQASYTIQLYPALRLK
jgi:hypothetical protein